MVLLYVPRGALLLVNKVPLYRYLDVGDAADDLALQKGPKIQSIHVL